MTGLAAPASNSVVAGVLGFLVVAALGLVLVFLLRSLNKQLRKVSGGPPWQAPGDDGGQPGDGPDPGSEGSQPPGSHPQGSRARDARATGPQPTARGASGRR